MWLSQYLEKRAIQKYLRAISPELRKRYGGSGPYTLKQVQTTINDLDIGYKYAEFAYFVFCSEEEYERYGFHFEQIKKYRGYRKDHFGGYCGDYGGRLFGQSGSGGDAGGGGGD